jgi:Cdc6-like AAA superfamily ATPase
MNDEKPVFVISDSPERKKAMFGFEEDVGILARLIANKKNQTPLVIGIYGSWGSGKTTLMETIKRQLEATPYDDPEMYRRCRSVWFQAWKYKNEDEILAALLEVILSAMKQEGFLGWMKAEIEEGILRGRSIPIDLDLLLHWNILEHISRDFINEVKRQGPGILQTLRDKILEQRKDRTPDEPWEPTDEMIKKVPQSLHAYFRGRDLVETLMRFEATPDQIRQFITLSQVVKSPEDAPVAESTADFGAMTRILEGPFL